MKIGIDASNMGPGGALTHLKEILENFDYRAFKDRISKIVVFSSVNILSALQDYDYLEKVTFPNLNKGILHRFWFQVFEFDKEILSRCDVLFSITGDYTGKFRPLIGMSQNMLLYERNIWKEINLPTETLRFG